MIFYVSFMIFFTCLFCRQRLTGKKFTITQYHQRSGISDDFEKKIVYANSPK